MTIVTPGRQAIVIGGSVAGLCAAKVLSAQFDQVIMLERDTELGDGAAPRKGVPQGRHLHQLLVRGAIELERLFPGLRQDLLDAGATPVEWPADIAWYGPDGPGIRFATGLVTYSCSRPLLEVGIRRNLLQRGNVTIQGGADVVGLLPDARDRGVAGVRLRDRGRSTEEYSLRAELVVDASGRSSRAPEWLGQLGYGSVRETVVNAQIGYATRVYAQPARHANDWRAMIIQGRAPEDRRAGAIFPVEGGRWMVLLAGAEADYPPTDDAGYLEYAYSLVSPAIGDALAGATPLSEVMSYRNTENRMRHYDEMRRWPERFVVLGDSACAFNPIYGQGMTTAALGALALEECLRADQGPSLARRFQQRLTRVTRTPWVMATGVDYRYPATQGAPRGTLHTLQHEYIDAVLELATRSPAIYSAFARVMHLLSGPEHLLQPAVLWPALRYLMAARKVRRRPNESAGMV
jgi:2-polyprenyl-6-methoxyphenol hydroxylase-like FAD-dependent oxidoreductase